MLGVQALRMDAEEIRKYSLRGPHPLHSPMQIIRTSLLVLAATLGLTSSPALAAGVPTITSASPSTVEAVIVDGFAIVTLTGTGFVPAGMTVYVGRDELSSIPLIAGFSVISGTVMTVQIPLLDWVGTTNITVIAPDGSARTTIQIVPNTAPTIDMLFSNPLFLFTTIGMDVNLGGQVGDLVILTGSFDLGASRFPGIADFAIGNNDVTLIKIAEIAIPATGHASVNIPLTGMPTGQTIHVQAASLTVTNGFALPMTMTNVQSGTVLF
jgi:hypothetical protein